MTNGQSAYIDDEGKPRLRPSIVGFLDLLGFSQRVMSASRNGDSQDLLELITSAIAESRSFVRQMMKEGVGENPRGWSVKFFSDNLVLGYAHEAKQEIAAAWFVIHSAQQYQLRMALNGMFLRGGLTQGLVCMTDEIIFGASLIECYELESKAAIVPRVLLSETLATKLCDSSQQATGAVPDDPGHAIARDVDGWWFVNYLESAVHDGRVDWSLIERHKQSILATLSTTTRHDVLPKFGWACRYHNMFCHWHRDDFGFDDRYRIARLDETSTICRLSDL